MKRYRRTIVGMALVVPMAMAGCQSPDGAFGGGKHSDWMAGGLNNSSTSAKEAPSPKLLPATYYAAGKLFEKQGQLEQAARKYSEAITVNHDYLAAYNRLGIVLTQLGRFEKADNALIRAIELAPDKAYLRNNLAFSYILQKRWTDAEAELANALHLNPNFVRARINLGMVQAKQARFADAFGTFRSVLPEADAYYNMGMLFNSLHRFQDAATAFEKARTLQPAMTSAQTQLDALAPRLAEPRPDEPRAGFTEDGIVDAALKEDAPAEVPAVDVAAIDEPEISPEIMPELKADAEAKGSESSADSTGGKLAQAEDFNGSSNASLSDEQTRDEKGDAPEAKAAEKQMADSSSDKLVNAAEPDDAAPEEEVASAIEPSSPAAASPRPGKDPAAEESVVKNESVLPATKVVGPPEPQAIDRGENEDEVVINFEHDRPDFTEGTKELSEEGFSGTSEQVAKTEQADSIGKVAMVEEPIEPAKPEPAPAEQTEIPAAKPAEPSVIKSAEPSDHAGEEADEAAQEQVSSAELDQPTGGETIDQQDDSETAEAASEPRVRTFIAITVQPQTAPEETDVEKENASTDELADATTGSESSPALEELMVDHADHTRTEEPLAQAEGDAAEAPGEISDESSESTEVSVAVATENEIQSEDKEIPANKKESVDQKEVSKPEFSPVVKSRKKPFSKRRVRNGEKLMAALYFDHHRPDFTSMPTLDGGGSQVAGEITGGKRAESGTDSSATAGPGETVAAVSTEGEDQAEASDDLKASPGDLAEPRDPEMAADSVNKAPIRILVTQRNSEPAEGAEEAATDDQGDEEATDEEADVDEE